MQRLPSLSEALFGCSVGGEDVGYRTLRMSGNAVISSENKVVGRLINRLGALKLPSDSKIHEASNLKICNVKVRTVIPDMYAIFTTLYRRFLFISQAPSMKYHWSEEHTTTWILSHSRVCTQQVLASIYTEFSSVTNNRREALLLYMVGSAKALQVDPFQECSSWDKYMRMLPRPVDKAFRDCILVETDKLYQLLTLTITKLAL